MKLYKKYQKAHHWKNPPESNLKEYTGELWQNMKIYMKTSESC
jgi:hypothetical protein